jgi:uncharacterized protein (DUF3084 family)
MHGNPWLRLLRREVEALARSKHGDRHVNEKQARAELTRVNREIRHLRTELAGLEEQRDKLNSALGELGQSTGRGLPRSVRGERPPCGP